MPLVPYNLKVLKAAMELAEEAEPGRRLVTLSCPDLIMPRQELALRFGKQVLELPYRSDSVGILAWHKCQLDGVVDSWQFFQLLGWQLTAFDVFPGRGQEILFDLNEPLPDDTYGTADVLFDCISNQCFAFGQVMKNCWNLVREGGYLVHCVPANSLNQGYHSVSPSAFHDFYSHNQGEILKQQLVMGIYRSKGCLPLKTIDRIRGAPDDTMNLVLARKSQHPVVPEYPIMGKFIRYPDCKR